MVLRIMQKFMRKILMHQKRKFDPIFDEDELIESHRKSDTNYNESHLNRYLFPRKENYYL